MRLPYASLLLVTVAAGAACGGDDGGSPPGPVSMTGTVVDYFAAVPVSAVALAIDGSTQTASSAANGTYAFPDVPRNTTVTIVGQLNSYRPTRNVPVAVTTTNASHDLAVVSISDANRQVTQATLPPSAGTASLYIDLADANGTPREGIPLTDMVLTTNGNPVGVGPYIFGAAGDVNPALTATAAFAGRSRVAFLNIPPGSHTFTLTLPGPVTLTVTAVTSADGVTLAER